ncbi:MAG: GNAT family N-acetyltransferase, partial [Janthinobacterium lividum]
MSTSGTPWSTVEDAVDYGSSLLRGRRCRLRALAEDDLPRLDAWWGDVETLALQGEVIRPQPAATREASIRMWSRNDTSGGVGFSVVDLSTEELVGHVTLW